MGGGKRAVLVEVDKASVLDTEAAHAALDGLDFERGFEIAVFIASFDNAPNKLDLIAIAESEVLVDDLLKLIEVVVIAVGFECFEG